MQLPVRAAVACASQYIGLISCATALSCGGETNGGAANAVRGGKSDSGSGGSTVSLGSGGSGIFVVGAGGGAAAEASVMVQVPIDAGRPPVVSCGSASDASVNVLDGAACAPPPSHCADGHTLVYYAGGRCVDGLCSWTTQLLTCPTSCSIDGCRLNFTR